MDATEMERTLKRLVRVLLVLLVVAIVGMIVILWQTPIGDAWRQIFVLLFGTRATTFMYLSAGAVVVVLAVVFLLVRKGMQPRTVAAAPVAARSAPELQTQAATLEAPLVFEPLSPKTEGTVWQHAGQPKQ